ncbi:hypothetical protein [Actinomadura fibrosa]|uniref:DUF3592 domain-containing protein n=1 Tax=Actinomadura fibrosa TaxID=111802 RepID=A0ABW2XNC0_9ACTN|nr:hypothetical protein [Actinomadura fibrosa]
MSQRKVSPAGALVAIGLWLVVALLPLVFGLADARLAFGLTGTPGTATVERCIHYGSGKHSRTDCRGRFVSDDRAAATRTVGLPPESDEGETFPAQLRPDGERARPTDAKGRLSTLALPALGLLFLVPLPWGLLYLFTDRQLGRFTRYLMAGAATALGAVCLVGLTAANL